MGNFLPAGSVLAGVVTDHLHEAIWCLGVGTCTASAGYLVWYLARFLASGALPSICLPGLREITGRFTRNPVADSPEPSNDAPPPVPNREPVSPRPGPLAASSRSPTEEAPGPRQPASFGLVLLLREPLYLEGPILARVAAQAWNCEAEFVPGPVPDSHSAAARHAQVTGAPPWFGVFHRATHLVVECRATPYFADPDSLSRHFREFREAEAVLHHRAYVAIRVLAGPHREFAEQSPGALAFPEPPIPDSSEPQPRSSQAARTARKARRQAEEQTVGRLAAGLVDSNCLAVWATASRELFVYDPTLEAKLCRPEPLSWLRYRFHPPVTVALESDPRLAAAAREAQRQWPRFLAEFQRRPPAREDLFLVKAPFQAEGTVEFMWLRVTAIEQGIVYGKLENQPAHALPWRLGDAVRVPESQVADWLYQSGGNQRGGFSRAALREIDDA